MCAPTNLAKRRLIANALLLLTMSCVALLYWFAPATHGFYPVCPIHEYLGILCPGCGATRAFAALLHGRVAEAIRLNALAVLGTPFAVAIATQSYVRAVQAREYRWPQVPSAALYSCLAAAAVFTMVRNLNW